MSPPQGDDTHTGEEGQGEVSRGGETADTAATVLEPILALPFLAAYRGTALCTPGFWFALCPEAISDPNEFFSRLADRLLSLACFLYGGLHWQAAATFITQEAARMVAVMTFCSGTPQGVRLVGSPQQQETAASARDRDDEVRESEDGDVYQVQRLLDAKCPRRGYPAMTK